MPVHKYEETWRNVGKPDKSLWSYWNVEELLSLRKCILRWTWKTIVNLSQTWQIIGNLLKRLMLYIYITVISSIWYNEILFFLSISIKFLDYYFNQFWHLYYYCICCYSVQRILYDFEQTSWSFLSDSLDIFLPDFSLENCVSQLLSAYAY